MKKTRQILSVFLSVCMIISCMAGFTFTVSAADDPRIIVSLGDSYSAGEGIAPYYGSKGMEYGYLWWIIDRQKNIYAAIGNSGNVIYVNPGKNTVISVASYFKPTIFDRVDFIQEYIEPTVT